MTKLSKESKQRLQQVFQCGQFIIRWGFIPTVLYLGTPVGWWYADITQDTTALDTPQRLAVLVTDEPDSNVEPIQGCLSPRS